MGKVNPLWENNELQFARLIDECAAAGVFHDKNVMETLQESMNLTKKEINSLVKRAIKVFENEKNKLTPEQRRQRFHKYVLEFYGTDGVYPMKATLPKVIKATQILIDKRKANSENVVFDTFDREAVRDILIEKFKLKFPKLDLR